MDLQNDITLKKPVSVWNRDLSISPKSFFGSLGKAAISGAVLDSKGVAENLLDSIQSLSPQDKPAYAAWLLVYKSLLQTFTELLNEYEEFCQEKIDDDKHQQLAFELESAINDIEVGFDASFFEQPQKLPLLKQLKQPLITWLKALGMSNAEATALHLRFKERFVLTLHKEWLAAPQDYACIEEALNSPFIQATRTQRSWFQYNAWLQEQTNERMFAEAFSLKQVFVPLRAYYEEKPIQDLNNHLHNSDNETKNIVVDLHNEIEKWLRSFDPDHAVRIISGGPGCGKSSFGKMFAAFVAREITEIPVIFIPLHHFDPTDDLVSAVKQFVSDERYLSGSPLDAKDGKERLLIIFDGLDELSMQGKAASETAHAFVDEVITKIDKFNGQGCQRQVLITGRDVAVQSASTRLRGDRQVLHVLPYFIDKDDFEEKYKDKYKDKYNLLAEDQRDLWWQNYGKAKGLTYRKLPDKLATKQLAPITAEPLLNYLVALSYERKKIDFSQQTNLNSIYQDLLQAVHDRQWDHGHHEANKYLKTDEFIRVLEEIALAVWHGDGRTATVKQIFTQCKNSNLGRHLETFQEGAEKGVSRLLTAFYFRQSEQIQAGDKTFEFTHKSFGEYLTARRIVRLVKQIDKQLTLYDEDPDEGFDEREALKRWAELCGVTNMDRYVFSFLCDEITYYPEFCKQWQQTFARLIGFTVRNSMPMELLGITKYKEMMRQSINAEESLMVIHFACATNTKKLVKINWGDVFAFGKWYKRVQGNWGEDINNLIHECLAWLDLSDCYIVLGDFFNSDLRGVNFENATLARSNFMMANLKGANLTKANLNYTLFESADLSQAKFEGAHLSGTDFVDAELTESNFKGAELDNALFTNARFKKTKLAKGYTIKELRNQKHKR
jgi:hypothetical protein